VVDLRAFEEVDALAIDVHLDAAHVEHAVLGRRCVLEHHPVAEARATAGVDVDAQADRRVGLFLGQLAELADRGVGERDHRRRQRLHIDRRRLLVDHRADPSGRRAWVGVRDEYVRSVHIVRTATGFDKHPRRNSRTSCRTNWTGRLRGAGRAVRAAGQLPGTRTLSMTCITPWDASTSATRIRAPSTRAAPPWTEGDRKSLLRVRIRVEDTTSPLDRSPGATWWSRTARSVATGMSSTPPTTSAAYRSSNTASVGAKTVNWRWPSSSSTSPARTTALMSSSNSPVAAF